MTPRTRRRASRMSRADVTNRLRALASRVERGQLDDREVEYANGIVDHFYDTIREWRGEKPR